MSQTSGSDTPTQLSGAQKAATRQPKVPRRQSNGTRAGQLVKAESTALVLRKVKRTNGTDGSPPTKANESTNKAAKQCPLDVLKPCDVNDLAIVAKVLGDTPKQRKLTTTKVLRNQLPPKGMSEDVVDALRMYDIVIDVVASYPSPEDPKPDEKVSIQCKSSHAGAKCHVHLHPLIVMNATHAALDGTSGAQTFSANVTGAKEYYAKKASFDFNTYGGKIGVVFELISSMWPGKEVAWVAFYAYGCGVREVRSSQSRNALLMGLVRIFRNDKWSISFSIPPLGSYNYEKAKDTHYVATGEVETSTTRSSRLGKTKKTIKGTTVTKKDGNVVRTNSGERSNGKSVAQYWNERGQTKTGANYYLGLESYGADGREFEALLPEKIASPENVKLTIKRNGKEIEVVKYLKNIIDKIKNIAELVKGALDAIRRIPQFGWKSTLSVSVMEGSIEGEWGPRMVDKTIGGRYLPVETYFNLKLKFKLIDASFDISFGFEATLGAGTQVILKANLTCSVSVPIEANVVGTHDPVTIAFKPEATVNLKAVAEVSVLGYHVVDAKAGADGGISAEGKIVFDPIKGAVVSGNIKRKKTELVAYASFKSGPVYPYKYEVAPEAPIASF